MLLYKSLVVSTPSSSVDASGEIYRVWEDVTVMRYFDRFTGVRVGRARTAAFLMAVVVVLGVVTPAAGAKVRRPTLAWDPGIEEIAHQVEHLRGLKFRRPVQVALGGIGFFGDRMSLRFSSNPSSSRDARHLRALGLLAPGVDVTAEYRALAGRALGYYNPASGTVHVRPRRLDAATKEIVAHELTHALDDQHFQFGRSGFGNELRWRAAQAIIEGDARRIELAYRDSLPREERRAAEDQLAMMRARVLKGVRTPADLEWGLVQSDAPYTLGNALTSVVVASRGTDALADLFRSPPHSDVGSVDPLQATTSGTWEERAVGVHAGEVADGSIEAVGAVDLYLLLASRGSASSAFATASQIAGASVAWFRRGSTGCARVTLIPRPGSLTAMSQGVDEWVAAMGAFAAREPADAGAVVFASCEGAPPLAPGAISAPEQLLAARGQAIATSLRAHHTVARVTCIGDSVLIDPTYRDEMAAAVRDQHPLGPQELDAAMGRARAACGV